MKKQYSIKTKYGIFQATIWFDKREKVYFVSVPAFKNVLTEARSLPEAKRYAGEVIELECLAALDEGKVVVDDTKHIYGKIVHSGAISVLA